MSNETAKLLRDTISTSLDQHVLPTLAQHKASPYCWCRPLISYTDQVNGGRVWVHKAAA